MLKCKSCGAGLDLTMSACPACGAELELGRLTGILGIVCRACDAYNEPGARVCAACGAAVGSAATPAAPAPPPSPPAAPPADPAPSAGRPPPAPAPGGAPSPLADGDLSVDLSITPEPGALPGAATGPAGPGDAPTPAALTPLSHTPPAGQPPRPASGPHPPPPAEPAAPTAAPAPGQPVVRAFQRGAPAATRFVPLVPSAAGAIPLATHCPRCGEEAGPGRFCQRCGQPLGAHGAQAVPRPAPARSAAAAFGPLAPGRAKLVLERGEGMDGATFRLNAERVAAGRSQGQVVFPEDPCLAPLHATFFYREGALHVRCEGSPGGLYLRLRGPSVPLRPGDLFAVGDRLLRYAGPLPAAPPGPPDGTRRYGAPRPASHALVVEELLEGGVGGRVFVRSGPSITIGRAGCAVNLGDDPFLSQAHAELVLEADGHVKLRDLGSSNGTYVRVPPHGERELHDGDGLRMGREVLRVAIA